MNFVFHWASLRSFAFGELTSGTACLDERPASQDLKALKRNQSSFDLCRHSLTFDDNEQNKEMLSISLSYTIASIAKRKDL